MPDYVIKLGFNVHDPTSTHGPKRSSVVNMTGVPIEYYELATKNAILHRIAIDPDEGVWFTELGADRIGTIKFEASRTHEKREASESVKQNEEINSSDQPPQPALRRSTRISPPPSELGDPSAELEPSAELGDPSAELGADRIGTNIFTHEEREASESVEQNEEINSTDRPPQPALRRTTLNEREGAAGRSHSVRFRKTRKFFSKATSVHGFFARPSRGAIP